jgi:hypothetical protein
MYDVSMWGAVPPFAVESLGAKVVSGLRECVCVERRGEDAMSASQVPVGMPMRLLSSSRGKGVEEDLLRRAAVKHFDAVARDQKPMIEIPWFYLGRDHDISSVKEMLELERSWLDDLQSMVGDIEADLLARGKSEEDVEELVLRMARQVHFSTKDAVEQAKIADDMMSSLESPTRERVRAGFVRFQTSPRLLHLLLNGRLSRFKSGEFGKGLAEAEKALVGKTEEEARIAKEKEALFAEKEARMHAEHKKIIEEEEEEERKKHAEKEARRKKLAEEEIKMVEEEEAAYQKRLAQGGEERAKAIEERRKLYAEQKAAWKKKLAEERPSVPQILRLFQRW